jgi:sarcosine oxidase subunit delta
MLCPYCGVRDEPEFSFGGTSHTKDDAYILSRKNPAGVHVERWLHIYGCGRWFNVARDARTHEVLTTYVLGHPPPDPSDA